METKKDYFKPKSAKERSYLTGYHKTIYLSALTTGSTAQYDKDGSDLKQLIKSFGYGNIMTILNQSDEDIAVDLNYSQNNRYIIPSGNTLALTSVLYESFNVVNMDTTNTSDNEVKIIIGYEREPLREWI
jgi:hypothetical protein